MSRQGSLLLVLFVTVAACGDNAFQGPGGNTLVRVDDEPAGANCEHGGVAIHTGADVDHDGTVDDSEITSTSYVCSSATGLTCQGGNSLQGVVTVFSTADFAQLAGITCIDGDLIVAGVPDAALPDLPLATVTGSVTIAGNTALTSLDGLGQLTKVGAVYAVQGNDALADIGALGALETIASVLIVGNDSLLDLAGLESWTTIQHHINISNNGSLQSLAGLDNLLITDKVINIKSNRSLTSLAALDGLRNVGVMEISGNAALPAISLAGLQKVNVTLVINSNAALATVALPSLVTTTGIQFHNNPALLSIDAPSLVVSNVFLVQVNSSLTSISAPNFAAATGQVELSALPALAAVDLTSLGTTGGAVVLSGLNSLANLSGFASLSSIAGDFTVRSCNALVDFAGLENLEDVSGNMVVASNAQLTGFTGMVGSFTTVGGSLTITGNPQLPLATAQAFASGVTVGGSVTIQ